MLATSLTNIGQTLTWLIWQKHKWVSNKARQWTDLSPIRTKGVPSRNYWVSAIKKPSKKANRTVNFGAGNGNWWRPCNYERKLLIGPEHTFHWIHKRTSSSLVGKYGWKAVGNHAIWFGFLIAESAKQTLGGAPVVLTSLLLSPQCCIKSKCTNVVMIRAVQCRRAINVVCLKFAGSIDFWGDASRLSISASDVNTSQTVSGEHKPKTSQKWAVLSLIKFILSQLVFNVVC